MKVVGKVFAVIFSIVYYFVLTALITLAFASNIVSSNFYANIFESIDLETIKVSDLKGFFNEDQFDDDATLEDVVVEYFSESGVEKTKVKALLDDQKARKIAGKVIGDIISCAMGGEKKEITKKEIEEFFTIPAVIDVTGEPTKENIDNLYKQLNEAMEEAKEGGINDGNTKRNSESAEVHR